MRCLSKISHVEGRIVASISSESTIEYFGFQLTESGLPRFFKGGERKCEFRETMGVAQAEN